MPAAASVAALVAFLSGLSPDAPLQATPPPAVVIELEESIHDAPLIARKIAWCESRFDGRAKNPNSTASGYFQFLDGTWEWVTGLPAPARDHPYSVQLEAWRTLWDEGRGAHHWEPSRYCWEQQEPWT